MGKEDEVVDKVLFIPTTLEPNFERVVISEETDPIKVVFTPLLVLSRAEATLIFEISALQSIPAGKALERSGVPCCRPSGSFPSPATRNSSVAIFSVEARRFSKSYNKSFKEIFL